MDNEIATATALDISEIKIQSERDFELWLLAALTVARRNYQLSNSHSMRNHFGFETSAEMDRGRCGQ